MTAIDSTGQRVRGFEVYVLAANKKRWLVYPVADGESALRTMRELERRGFTVQARTFAEYSGEEWLSTGEMDDLYGDGWAEFMKGINE